MTHRTRIQNGQRVPCGTGSRNWRKKGAIFASKVQHMHQKKPIEELMAPKPKKVIVRHQEHHPGPEVPMEEKARRVSETKTYVTETKNILKNNQLEHK